MKREELKALGLSEEQIEAVMKTHGIAVTDLKKQIDAASTAQTRAADLEKQLSEASKAIEDFKGMDIDGIKKAAGEWETKAKQAEKDAAERIDAITREAYAKEYAAGLKFSSKAARNQFVKDLLAENLKYKDGAMLGADDFRAKYAEADPEAFKIPEPPPAGQVSFGAGHEKGADGKAEIANKILLDRLVDPNGTK